MRWGCAVAVLVLVATAGCAARAGGGQAAYPGPDCLSAATVSPPAAPVGPAAAEPTAAEPLPDLVLPCLDGGRPVRLAATGSPMVINLWASWCAPCRQELPEFQRFADRTAGRVRVVGVDTNDGQTAARALVGDLRLGFPMLFDSDARLLAAVGRTALPVTLFVDGTGRIRYLYNAQPLDEATLTALTRRYLGAAAMGAAAL